MDLRRALTEYRPNIEERYRSYVKDMLEHLKAIFGPKLQGVANSKYYVSYSEVRVNFKLVMEDERDLRPSAKGEFIIDEDRLNRNALLYADQTIERWLAKIESKVGDLEDAKVHRLSDMRFEIEGIKNGHSVRIDQDMIVNQSAKGKLFNQFPARIYVDGKLTPESKYIKMWEEQEVQQTEGPAKKTRFKIGM